MTRPTYLTLWLPALAICLAACGAQRPALYPNEKFNQAGDAVAQRDVDECMERAKQYEESGGKAKDVATSTAVGAGTGAAIGAVGGAVTGDAGRGAAVGAATGGTAGLLHGMFGASEPSPLYKGFVERCLREKGYDPMGWQ